MKRLIAVCGAAVAAAGIVASFGLARAEKVSLAEGCRSACLIDSGSGEILFGENEKLRTPIASVCKVMSASDEEVVEQESLDEFGEEMGGAHQNAEASKDGDDGDSELS